jgi:ribosome-binding factor A
MDPARARKLGGRIAQIVAEMLERRIKDPRLGFVTVTEARLTNDLREATVFYTVYGSAEERAGTAAALASAVGVIRSEVGRQTGLRHTPSLEFKPDTLPDNARNIEELVARAREADAAVAAVRVGAEPAGEADPYRVPADPADDSGDSDPGDEDSWDEDSWDEDSAGADRADRSSAGDDLAGADPAGQGSAGDGLAGGPPAGQSGQSEHLAETPASGERGAGYSRS